MRLVEISAGYWLPRALHVVADLAVADALDEERGRLSILLRKSALMPMLWTASCDCSRRMACSVGVAVSTYTMRSLLHCRSDIRSQCVHTYG